MTFIKTRYIPGRCPWIQISNAKVKLSRCMKPNETKTVLLLVSRPIQNGILHGFWWPGGSKHLARPRALIRSRDKGDISGRLYTQKFRYGSLLYSPLKMFSHYLRVLGVTVAFVPNIWVSEWP